MPDTPVHLARAVPCWIDERFQGEAPGVSNLEPHLDAQRAIAIPLERRRVEEALMRMGLRALDDPEVLGGLTDDEMALLNKYVQFKYHRTVTGDTPALAAIRKELEG